MTSKSSTSSTRNGGGGSGRGVREKSATPTYPPVAVGNQNLLHLHDMSLGVFKALSTIGSNITQIAKEMGIARSTVREHLNKLAKYGLVEKITHPGLWKFTQEGKRLLPRVADGVAEILVPYERRGGESMPEWLHDRAHNIKVRVLVESRPSTKAWLDGWYVNDRVKNNVFYSSKFGDIGMTYTKKSIIFQLPILYFESSEIALAEGMRIVRELTVKLEHEIEGLKLGKKYKPYVQEIITQHHAMVGEPYAEFLTKHGISYKGINVDIDASKGKKTGAELEFTNAQESHIHHSVYAEHVEDIIIQEEPAKISQITSTLGKITAQIGSLGIHTRDTMQIQTNTNKQLEAVVTLHKSLIESLHKKPEQDEVRNPDMSLSSWVYH